MHVVGRETSRSFLTFVDALDAIERRVGEAIDDIVADSDVIG